jgi:hypothetical protein
MSASGRVASIRSAHDRGEHFSVEVVTLLEGEAGEWVEFRSNPQRFLPTIFDGDWADQMSHPSAGDVRIVRVLRGRDGVIRVIGRQGSAIYACPWIG